MTTVIMPDIAQDFASRPAVRVPLRLIPRSKKDRRLSLLHRIHRRYPTLTENFRFGSAELPFTRIADPDRVLDDVVAEEDRREKTTGVRLADPPHLPYWAELWESASAIAQRICNENISPTTISPTTRVLDLGCGMGLAGVAAASMGARVLLADLETPALLFAQLNALPFGNRATTRRLDWRNDSLDDRFDLILGSDILYEKQQWEYLDRFWKLHLTKDGCILLGEPGRQTGEMFIPWIAQRDWLLSESFEWVASGKKRIRIFELRRKNDC